MGRKQPLGLPIESLREQFGGNDGYVTDPFGGRHGITHPDTLANGEDIYVGMGFVFRKPHAPGG